MHVQGLVWPGQVKLLLDGGGGVGVYDLKLQSKARFGENALILWHLGLTRLCDSR